MKEVQPGQLDQAYEYINWWLSGWAGAFVAAFTAKKKPQPEARLTGAS
jgi:hypothetical protein